MKEHLGKGSHVPSTPSLCKVGRIFTEVLKGQAVKSNTITQ